MKGTEQQTVEDAFTVGNAKDVRVIRRSDGEYYFTFVVDDPFTKKPETYALLTQRGELRTWADPRTLHKFLQQRCGVHTFITHLTEDVSNEPTPSDPGRSP
jgi:hypothetical protein